MFTIPGTFPDWKILAHFSKSFRFSSQFGNPGYTIFFKMGKNCAGQGTEIILLEFGINPVEITSCARNVHFHCDLHFSIEFVNGDK